MTTIGEGVIKVKSDTGDFSSGLTGALSSVGKVASTTFAVASAAAVGFGVSAFSAAARVGEMDQVLNVLSKTTGISRQSMDDNVAAIRKSGIEYTTAQALVAQFARSNLDLADATKLSKVAQDAAVVTGKNSTETLNDMLYAIQTGNSSLGIFKDMNIKAGDATAAYAASIGKSVKELTAAEKSQALLNAFIEAGVPIAGAYAAAMEEPGKVLRSFPRIFDDIKVSIGDSLVKAFGPFIIKAYDLAKAISESLAPGKGLREVADAIGQALGRLVEPLTGVITKLADWVKKIEPGQFSGLTKAFDSIGPAAAGAGAAIFTMGAKNIPIVGDLLKGINPLASAFIGLALTSPEVQAAIGDLFQTLAPVAAEVLPKLIAAFHEVVGALAPVIAEMLKVGAVGLAAVLLEIVGPLVDLVKFLAPMAPVFLAMASAMKVASIAMGILQAVTAAFGITLTISVGWVFLIVAAVAALVAGLILAYQKVDWFRDAVDAVVGVFKDVATAIWGFINGSDEATKKLGPFKVILEAIINPIRGIIDALKGLVQFFTGVFTGDWGKAWDGLKQVAEGALRAFFPSIMAVVSTFGPAILDFFSGLGAKVVDALAGVGNAIVDFFTSLPGLALGALSAFGGMIADFFSSIPGIALDALKALPGLLEEAIVWAITAMIVAAIAPLVGLYKLFTEVVPTIVGYVIDLAPKLAEVGWNAITAMAEAIGRGAVAVWNFFLALPGTILGLVAAAGSWLIDTGLRLLAGLVNGITTGAAAVWNFFLALPGQVLGFVAAAGSWLVNDGIRLLHGLLNGAVAGVAALWNFLWGLPGQIIGVFAAAGSWLWNAGVQLIQGLINGIGSMAGALADKVTSMAKSVIDKVTGIFDIFSPSRVMFRIGHNVGEGFVLGIEAMGRAIDHAVEDTFAVPDVAPVGLDWTGADRAGAGGRDNYTLNLYPQTADMDSVLAGFRRLELIGGVQ